MGYSFFLFPTLSLFKLQYFSLCVVCSFVRFGFQEEEEPQRARFYLKGALRSTTNHFLFHRCDWNSAAALQGRHSNIMSTNRDRDTL